MTFRDRTQAGRELAGRLVDLDLHDPVVLGLPRGGIPVAVEVADALGAPAEAFVALKVGAPGHEELGIGAVAEGSDVLVISDTAHRLGVADSDLHELAERARRELDRRVDAYRAGRELPDLTGRDTILVDDGLATGVTAEAALRSLRTRGPRRLILAIPTCARETRDRLRGLADDVICVLAPEEFYAVGQWYDDFSQTTDEEVLDLLATSRARSGGDR